MQRSILFFGLSSIVALGGAIAACSSTTTTTTDTVDAAPEADVRNDAGKDAAKVEEDSGTTLNPDKQCAAMATQEECGQCCGMNHPSGYAVFLKALIDCSCKGIGIDGGADGGAGACATECADTLCKSTPAQPNAACNTCLQGAVGSGGACNEPISSACMADEDCMAQQKCIVPCASKK